MRKMHPPRQGHTVRHVERIVMLKVVQWCLMDKCVSKKGEI